MGTVDWESHVIGFIVLHNEKGETLHLNPKYIKFFGTFDNRTEILLKYASDTIIKRHVLINGKANPYCAKWDRYYRRRYAMSKAA